MLLSVFHANRDKISLISEMRKKKTLKDASYSFLCVFSIEEENSVWMIHSMCVFLSAGEMKDSRLIYCMT
jgi:hypothetical protein